MTRFPSKSLIIKAISAGNILTAIKPIFFGNNYRSKNFFTIAIITWEYLKCNLRNFEWSNSSHPFAF